MIIAWGSLWLGSVSWLVIWEREMRRGLCAVVMSLFLAGCGTSCASNELQDRLNGTWEEVPSQSLNTEEALMERILFGEPPLPEEIRHELEWDLHEDALALLALRMKTSRTPAEQQRWTERMRDFREKQEKQKQKGHLTVDGSVMVFSRGVKEQRATGQGC